jgi:hypothetical protein
MSYLLSIEDGGKKLLRNIGNYVPVGMASHPGRLQSSSTLLTEPQISRILQAHAFSSNSNATHRRITKYRTTDIFNCNKIITTTIIDEYAVFRNLNGLKSNNTRVIAKSHRVREERVH